MAWGEPATSRQIHAIAELTYRLGRDEPIRPMTRREASNLINEMHRKLGDRPKRKVGGFTRKPLQLGMF
jgi:hypothetical protein